MSKTIVYVANSDSNEIGVLSLDPETGDLTPVETVRLPGVNKAGMPLAASPDRRHLYAGQRGDPPMAVSYAVDQTSGRLSYLGSGPLAGGMAYIVTDRAGRFLLGAAYHDHLVSVNPIAAGVVQPSAQVIRDVPNAHSILPDAANRHVLAASLGSGQVRQFRFDAATGTLSPNDPPAAIVGAKAGPRHFRFHPNGKVVYLLNELDGSLYVLAYDAGAGTLRELQRTSTLPPGFSGKPTAADIQVTPDGRFVYTSERTSSTLAGFAIDATTGLVTPAGHVPTEKRPRGFAIDPSGRYLLAVGQDSNAMSSYAIDAETGRLTRLKQMPMGKSPNWVEIIRLP